MDIEKYCRTCKKGMHCCIFEKGGFTFVSLKNAKEIKRRINKEYDCFLDYSALPAKEINKLKNCDPALEGRMRYTQLSRENRILRLKTKEGGRCIFLNGRGRCGIHSIRPNICRMFPFWGIRLTDGRIRIILQDIDHRCEAAMSLAGSHEEIEKALSKHEIITLKKVFREIEKEDHSYKKDISKLIKENKYRISSV